MDLGRGIAGFVGVAFIAAVVAFSVSAPRNADDMMNQEMASLGGKSINQTMAETQAEARADQCERFSQLASDAWDKAVNNDTLERDTAKIEEMDRQAERFCE